MFEYIYQWLQNLAFYMILVTAMLHVIPNRSYEKYIRFFCGLILVIILASPILKLFGSETKLTEFYQDAEYRNTVSEMEDAAEYIRQLEESVQEEEEQ